jgi:predicted phosphodiesterase
MKMKILLLSDVHDGEDTNYVYAGGDAYINTFGSQAERLVAKVLQDVQDLSIDVVVDLGDAIAPKGRSEDQNNYQAFISLFARSGYTRLHALGNHDRINLSIKDLMKINGQGAEYFSNEILGYKHIVLDAQWSDNDDFTVLGEEQLDWVKDEVSSSRLPIIIYSHHPITSQDLSGNYYYLGDEGRVYVKERNELSSLFTESKVMAVFSGHTHFFQSQMKNSILYSTVPSLTENDGGGKPCGKYLIAELKGTEIKLRNMAVK